MHDGNLRICPLTIYRTIAPNNLSVKMNNMQRLIVQADRERDASQECRPPTSSKYEAELAARKQAEPILYVTSKVARSAGPVTRAEPDEILGRCYPLRFGTSRTQRNRGSAG